MTVTLALAGDTMLGRLVAQRLDRQPDAPLLADEVARAAREADLFALNLECCVSGRGERWPDPAKPFFFRAPPLAAAKLADLGVDVVTLANNHALDYGRQALLDTLAHLTDAGIRCVGAGGDLQTARRPVVLDVAGARVALIGVADHPSDYAAGPHTPGIAYADLRRGVPRWLLEAIASADADVVVVTPHWGPNMTTEPVGHVRAAAPALVGAGATLIAGHSAHVFHGVQRLGRSLVLYDLGDFVDDYAVDPVLRNDLGLLWLVTLDPQPVAVQAVPLALEVAFTRLATAEESGWIARRLGEACAPFGIGVVQVGGRLTLELPEPLTSP